VYRRPLFLVHKKNMITIFRFFLVISTVFSTVSVTALPQDTFTNEIEFASYIIMPEELLYRVAAGEGAYLLIDIRPEGRFANGHIKGAVHLEWPNEGSAAANSSDRSLHQKESLEAMLPLDIDALLIDEEGERSFELLRYLLSRGYTRVWVVEGGMQNWPYGEYLETVIR
jgi:rhodanese-related sulfurtransferase